VESLIIVHSGIRSTILPLVEKYAQNQSFIYLEAIVEINDSNLKEKIYHVIERSAEDDAITVLFLDCEPIEFVTKISAIQVVKTETTKFGKKKENDFGYCEAIARASRRVESDLVLQKAIIETVRALDKQIEAVKLMAEAFETMCEITPI
jgi:hypothetical protein